MRTKAMKWIAAACGALLIGGCGGGGGDGSIAPPAAGTVTLSGVAATGAPFAGATVTVYDASGVAAGTAPVQADGNYSVTLAATVQAPLVLEAVRDDQTLVSMTAQTQTSHLNITPLTLLIAARLSPNGDPLALRSNAAVITTEALQARVEEVKTILQPLLAALGDTVDPLTGDFAANGSGHDKVLDSVDVQIHPAGAVSNIEVAVKGADATDRTSFTSADATPPPLPAVSASDLPPDNTAGLLQNLTTRITACFALPLQDRVNGASSNTGTVTGTAADVKAPACRTLFLGDDPATFLSNGQHVGRDANNNGAFAGLFRGGATGVVFENAQMEFLRNNDEHDIVFTYRTRDTAGNIAPDQLIARNVNGTLKLVGNGYIYSARVRAFAQDREFVNQPAADYVSVGYDVNINNQVDGSGNLLFSKVVVTTPFGTTINYRPSAARSFLTIVKPDGTLAGSPVVRLASKFKNPGTAGRPEQFESGVFVVSPQFTEEQLRAIPEKGVWTLEFFHADGRPNVVQSYRTIARAPTLAEQGSLVFAQPTAAARSEIAADSAQNGVSFFGPPSATDPNVVDLSTQGGGAAWTLPGAGMTLTSVTAFGIGPDPDGTGPQARVSFTDTVGVGPTATTARITCSPQSNADNHCDNSTGVQQYANNSGVTSIEVFGLSPRLVELSKVLNLFYILPR